MERNLNSLKDRRIVLTGASSGIGKAATLRFSKLGARVLAVGRDEKKLTQLGFESKNFKGKVFPHICDVTSPEEIEALLEISKKIHLPSEGQHDKRQLWRKIDGFLTKPMAAFG